MSFPVLLISDRPEVADVLGRDPAGYRYKLTVRRWDSTNPTEIATQFPLVLLDVPGAVAGVSLGMQLRAVKADLEFILVLPQSQERGGIGALRSGAFDYVLWAPEPDEGTARDLWASIGRAVDKLAPQSALPNLAPMEGRFGSYKLYRRLAVGGMAEVYLAQPKDSQTPVVIKRMRPDLAEREEFQSMFIDEAKITSRLEHPNIVSVLDFGTIDGHLFIAMEYIPGCNLAHLGRLADWKFPAPLACFIVSEICRALDYAHNATDDQGAPLDIIHRDVSPPNVLLSIDGRVMLADFGIAKATERQTETVVGVIKGRIDYMSPEQVAGYPLDRRTDLWAAGTMLYQMLTQVHPFRGANADETFIKLQGREIQAPRTHDPQLDSELNRICVEALAREPDHRFPDAESMQEELGDWIVENARETGPDTLRTFVDRTFGASVTRWEESDSFSLTDSTGNPDPGAITGVPGVIPDEEWLERTSLEKQPQAEPLPDPPEITHRAVAVPTKNTEESKDSLELPGDLTADKTVERSLQDDPVEADRTVDWNPDADEKRNQEKKAPAPPAPLFPSARDGSIKPWLFAAGGSALLFLIVLAFAIPQLFAERDPTQTPVVKKTRERTPRPTRTRIAKRTPRPTPKPTAKRTPKRTARPTPVRTAQPTPRKTAPPARPGKGALSIWVDTWATIAVNGTPIKQNAPIVGLALPEGVHRITLENKPLGKRKDITVRIVKGQTTKINVKLR